MQDILQIKKRSTVWYFWNCFRCYLEGGDIVTVIDNQVLKYVLHKKENHRKERRLISLKKFGITKVSFNKGTICVLRNVMSGLLFVIKNDQLDIDNLKVWTFNLPGKFQQSHSKDGLFHLVLQVLIWKMIKYYKNQKTFQRLKIRFLLKDERLFYKEKLCMPSINITEVLVQAHDSETAGHYTFSRR